MKRFKWWAVECITSLIVIVSYLAYKDIRNAGSRDDFNEEDYWIFFNSIFSVFLSLLGVVACIFPQEHNVCRLESILVWLLVICWSTTSIVAIVGPYTPSEQLLTNYRFTTFHPNVYFFSLWCMMVSMIMMASWYREFVFTGNDWSTSTQWILLGAMSFYVMLSGIAFRDANLFINITDYSLGFDLTKQDIVELILNLIIGNDGNVNDIPVGNFTNDDYVGMEIDNMTMDASLTVGNVTINNLKIDNYNQTNELLTIFQSLIQGGILEALPPCQTNGIYSCVRIHYAIGLGAASAVVACVMTTWKGTSSKCQNDVAIILFIFWFSALILLTVSPGPATRAGNLYFGIYFCYFLTLNILVTSTTSTKKPYVDFERDSTESIRRGDVWKTAYGKLERNKRKGMKRSDSYGSLFDAPEEWDENRDVRINERHHSDKVDDSKIPAPCRQIRAHEKHEEEVTDSGITINQEDELNSGATGLTSSRIMQGHSKEVNNSDLRMTSSSSRIIHEALNGVLGNDSRGSAPQTYDDVKDWKRRVQRLELWCILLTMAIVIMYTLPRKKLTRPTTGYIIASVSIIASCVGLVTSLRTSKLSNFLQTFSIVSVFINWVAGTITFLEDNNSHVLGYQTDEQKIQSLFGGEAERVIDDPNVFFGVVVSIITAILLTTNRCRASLTTTDWVLLAASSGTLLITSTGYLKISESDLGITVVDDADVSLATTCSGDHSLPFCIRIAFANYLGIATIAVSTIMAFLCKARPIWHLIVSIPLVLLWGYGIPYVTLSNTEATSAAVYLTFWGGIILSLDITTINIMLLHRNREIRRGLVNDENVINSSESPNENHELSAAGAVAAIEADRSSSDDQDQDQDSKDNNMEDIEISF